MDDAGDYRYTRRRRAITVAVSVVATVALCVGYAVADMCDVVPGVLTLRHVEHSTAAAAGRSIEAADVIADIDASKTIDPAAARALTDAFRASAAGFGGEFSIAIADASGNVVAENNIDVPRTPASTMKTLTAYAAAVELDMGKTPDTQTYLEQSRDGTARLALKGNGDMLLGAGASDANHINGRAGLGTLAGRTAQALRQRGITSVTLAYDDTLFGNDRWPQGIAELDTDHLYYAPTASMAVDGGRNWNGTGPANPDVFSAYPALSMQPARDAALVFQQRLAEQGITVQGFVSQGTVAGGIPSACLRAFGVVERDYGVHHAAFRQFARRGIRQAAGVAGRRGQFAGWRGAGCKKRAGAQRHHYDRARHAQLFGTYGGFETDGAHPARSATAQSGCGIGGRPQPKECPSWASSAPLRAV